MDQLVNIFKVDILLIKNIMLLGTGKSAINNYFLIRLPKEKYVWGRRRKIEIFLYRFVANVVNFSARTSSNQTMDTIMSKLDR